jgi:hypothetical protein
MDQSHTLDGIELAGRLAVKEPVTMLSAGCAGSLVDR